MKSVEAGSGGGDSLLVNYWYANPVGHTVEALRYCLGYHRADPELRISLLLNATTATELALFCPFIESTFAVDYGFYAEERDPADALAGLPSRPAAGAGRCPPQDEPVLPDNR